MITKSNQVSENTSNSINGAQWRTMPHVLDLKNNLPEVKQERDITLFHSHTGREVTLNFLPAITCKRIDIKEIKARHLFDLWSAWISWYRYTNHT